MTQVDLQAKIEQILAKYSHDVQDLIAGHKPFDDGDQAGRYRFQAKTAITELLVEARLCRYHAEEFQHCPQCLESETTLRTEDTKHPGRDG